MNISRMISTLPFKPFDRTDWLLFSGCEHPFPSVLYAEEWVLVVDGDRLTVSHTGQNGTERTENFLLSAPALNVLQFMLTTGDNT